MKFGKFFKGIGVSESDQEYFDTLVSIDVHSNPGKAQCSRAMVDADTTDIAASLPTCSIVTSAGDLFQGIGTKIIKVSGGVVSLVHTCTQGAVLGLGEHQGYLYYATATKLGRITVALASSQATWSSHNDSWATFTNQKPYKPMMWVNQILCIGDGHYVALVDENGTFVANGLDVLEHDVITALHNMNDYLAVGTFVNSAVHQASFYNWDTYSPSWTEDYKLKERGVNMFFDIDGYTYAQCGSIGNLYQWTGERAVFFRRLRDANNAITTTINPYGATNINGLTLINTNRGVFSFGRASATIPMAMVIEYVSSQGQAVTPGCIEAIGSDFYMGWQNGSACGIDHLSANYATGKIITPEIDGKVNKAHIRYTSMPENCSITARLSRDNGAFASHDLVKDDTDKREFYSAVHFDNKSTAQLEISLVPSGATTPIIKEISI